MFYHDPSSVRMNLLLVFCDRFIISYRLIFGFFVMLVIVSGRDDGGIDCTDDG